MLDREGFRPNVGIILLNANNEVWWGKRVREHSWQFPQGGIKYGETPEQAMYRELEEEIGVTANKIEKLTEFYVSPGFLTEKMHLYLATDLTETAQNLEEDELLSIERIGFTEAFDKIRNGEIEDAKTIIGLILAGAKFGFSF